MTAERDALAELVAAGDEIIRTCGMSGTAEYDAATKRNSAAWAAARAALAAPAQGEPQPEDDFVIPCAIDGCKQPSQMPASEYCSLHSAIGTSPTGGEFAPQPAAAPAQGEPQERMGTHWDGCSTEGGPRHYDCAVAAIAALRAENERQAREIARLTKARDEWIGRAQGSRNNTETMIERAERAEYERDDWKRKYGDANEWGLRNTAAWKDRAERAEAEARESNERAHAETERRMRAEAECADLRRRLDEHIDDKERALRLSAKESTRLTTEVERLRADKDAYHYERAERAEAECERLRAVIRDHNDGLQQMCDAQAATGRCDAWRSRGKSCVDCPRDFVIDAAREGK